MTRVLAMTRLLVVGLASAVVVSAVSSCFLPPYPNGVITCVQGKTACPEPLQCVDVHHDGQPVCVATCGDGVLNPVDEACDDANQNEFDLCTDKCTEAHFEASAFVGLGPTNADPAQQKLGEPLTVAVDREGNAYVSAFGPNIVFRFDAAENKLTAFAGDGSFVGADAAGGASPNEIGVAATADLAVDGAGNVYIADFFDNVVRRVDAVTGAVTTVVTNRPGDVQLGDDPQAVATTALVRALAVDGDGTLFFVDTEPGGAETFQKIRRVDSATGVMTTLTAAAANGVDDFANIGVGGIGFDDAGFLYALGDDRILVFKGSAAFATLGGLASGCPPVRNTQKQIAVAPEGFAVFFASDFKIVRADLKADGFGNFTATCTTLGSVPAQSLGIPISAQTNNPGPLDVAYSRGPKGDAILAADPGNGVVWSFDPNTPGKPTVAIGDASGGNASFAEDIVVLLASETDARTTVSETLNCAADVDLTKGRLQAGLFEFFAPVPEQHRVASVTCANHIEVFAGTGDAATKDGEGDGGPPSHALFATPVAATRGRDGNVYIVDREQERVRVVTGDTGDPATAHPIIDTFLTRDDVVAGKKMVHPAGIAVDDSGQLLIADSGNGRIVRIGATSTTNADGTVHVAPDLPNASEVLTGLLEPSSIVFVPYAISTQLIGFAPSCAPAQAPGVLAPDPCGILIYAERTGQRVRATTLAPLPAFALDLAGTPGDETPTAGDRDVVDDGSKVHSELRFPRGVMADIPTNATSGSFSGGNLLVMDGVHRLRRVTMGQLDILHASLTTTTTTITAADGNGVGLASSDDAVDGSGVLRGPQAMAFLDATHALILDHDTGTLRLLDVTTRALATVAGLPDGDDPGATATPAAVAQTLAGADGFAVDVARKVAYASESAARPARIRRFHLVDPATPSSWTSDVFPAGSALDAPSGIAIDPTNGDLYVADRGAHVVWHITADGKTTEVVAGHPGQRGFLDDVAGKDALLDAPEGVAVFAPKGRHLLYIADTGNNRVRRIDLDDAAHTIGTILGDGSAGSGGEGAPARAFPVLAPRGLAFDEGANLFVTSGSAVRIVQADSFTDATSKAGAGVVDGSDDVATIYGAPPRATFPEPVTRCIAALAVAPGTKDHATNLYALDSCLGLVVQLVRK